MSDMEFPSCAYDVCAEFDCEETMALALIATRNDLERTRKALEVALDWLGQVATPEKCDDDLCREFTKRKLIEIKTALEQKDIK